MTIPAPGTPPVADPPVADPPPPADPPPNGGGPPTADEGLQATVEAERKRRQAAEAELARFRAEREEAARKAAEEAGQYRELYEQGKGELESTREQLTRLQERETARLERVTTSNAKRTKALPAHLRDLVPPGLDPDAVAEHLGKLEKLPTESAPRGVRTHGGGDKPEIPQACVDEAMRTPGYGEAHVEEFYKRVWLPREQRRKAREPNP